MSQPRRSVRQPSLPSENSVGATPLVPPTPSESIWKQYRWLAPAIAGGGGLVALLFVLLLTLLATTSRGTPTPVPTPVAIVITATPAPVTAAPIVITATSAPFVPTPTPSCLSATTFLPTFKGQEERGNWKAASETIQSALTTQGFCESDKPFLMQRAVDDAYEAIFATTVDKTDAIGQRHQVDDYHDAQRLAQSYRVTPTTLKSSIQVARRAYEAGRFLVAKESFDDALRANEISPLAVRQDFSLASLYVSTLYNLGHWWVAGSGQTREDGIRFLVASYRLDNDLNVNNGAAYGELRQLIPDQSKWPPPANTPLLPQ